MRHTRELSDTSGSQEPSVDKDPGSAQTSISRTSSTRNANQDPVKSKEATQQGLNEQQPIPSTVAGAEGAKERNQTMPAKYQLPVRLAPMRRSNEHNQLGSTPSSSESNGNPPQKLQTTRAHQDKASSRLGASVGTGTSTRYFTRSMASSGPSRDPQWQDIYGPSTNPVGRGQSTREVKTTKPLPSARSFPSQPELRQPANLTAWSQQKQHSANQRLQSPVWQKEQTNMQIASPAKNPHPFIPVAASGSTIGRDLPLRRFRERTPPVAEPRPTREYLTQAASEPTLLSAPQPLLIIFDLNGTLLYRGSRKNLTSFVTRPGFADFVDWLMDADGTYGHRHCAMVWSSAKPENVGPMVNKLFTAAQVDKLAAVWARDKLGLTSQQYANKVQVYKELSKIWGDPLIKQFYPGYTYPIVDDKGQQVLVEEDGWWDQTNTVLVDDSLLKAISEPHNLLEIPEFENREDQQGDRTLVAVRKYLEELAKYADVSTFMKRYPFSQVSKDQ